LKTEILAGLPNTFWYIILQFLRILQHFSKTLKKLHSQTPPYLHYDGPMAKPEPLMMGEVYSQLLAREQRNTLFHGGDSGFSMNSTCRGRRGSVDMNVALLSVTQAYYEDMASTTIQSVPNLSLAATTPTKATLTPNPNDTSAKGRAYYSQLLAQA
jgi:hypothetical protein